MIALFIIGLLLHCVTLILPALVRDSRRLNVAANLLNAVALICGLCFSLDALISYHPVEYRFALPAAGVVPVRFDGLSLFFLFTFQLLSLAASLFAIGYLRPYIASGLSVRAHLCFFTLLILSLQLLVIVHNALVFLVIWESWPSAVTFRLFSTRTMRKSAAAAFGISWPRMRACFLLYRLFLYAA